MNTSRNLLKLLQASMSASGFHFEKSIDPFDLVNLHLNPEELPGQVDEAIVIFRSEQTGRAIWFMVVFDPGVEIVDFVDTPEARKAFNTFISAKETP